MLGPEFLSKVDLYDSYMHIWVCLADTPSLAFLIPQETEEESQILGF